MSASSSSSHKHDFIPSRQADLLNWSSNFNDLINTPPGPASFGLTLAQAAEYAALHDAFAIALATGTNPATNSKANVQAKNTARDALKAQARALARLIRATPGITNAQKAQLGLTIADAKPTPLPRPSETPLVSLRPSMGRTMHIRLSDRSSQRKGKPIGVAGAAVFSYVCSAGESGPSPNDGRWTFHGNATRPEFDIHFDSKVPSGAAVWIKARWYNPRGQFGPASSPQMTHVGYGVSMMRDAA